MKRQVPYFDLPAQMAEVRLDIEAAIARVLDDCRFCLGPEVEAFEREFAAFIDAPHAVGFNSGTSALHIALKLLEVGPGDEVITTPFTFVATSWAISYVGARPVYVDIDAETMNLDPARVEEAITPATKLILPVHLFGLPCDLNPLLDLCRKHRLRLVEDAAQAHGAVYRGRKVGTFSEMAAFSFYPGKNLGACGEAGALVMKDATLAARARSLREHGSKERYHHEEIGFNYRMEGIQGAVLRVKLKQLEKWNAARRKIAALYTKNLRETPLRLPVEPAPCQSAWHLYVARHPRRDELKQFLEQNGIGCALHYPLPLHLQECYRSLGYGEGSFPVAERAARECLSLPIFPGLSQEDVEFVAGKVLEFFQS
jgi:dTDP-4-amino-4,6-dideoxygalactose transaminase